MAVQIISDLGLHLNLELEYSRLGTRGGKDDDIAIVRRNLFWAANTIDTYEHNPSFMLLVVPERNLIRHSIGYAVYGALTVDAHH